MVGQAPYVVNGGLTYTSTGGATNATLLYNRVGERIDGTHRHRIGSGASPSRDFFVS